MTTHQTLLGSTTFDGEFISNEDGSLFTQRYIYPNADIDRRTDNLQARDTHQIIAHSVGYNEDGEIYSVHSNISSPHSEVYIANGRGHVAVYPSHPRYDSYPFPEEALEPGDEPQMGKIIAQWDIEERFLGDDIPF